MGKIRAFWLSILALGTAASLDAATSDQLRQMGDALMQKGLYAKAVDYYQQAGQADPQDWRSLEGLGNAYLKLEEDSQALDAFQRSLQANPENPALQALVDKMKAQGTSTATQAPSSLVPNMPADSQWEAAQPVTVIPGTPAASTPVPSTELVPVYHKRVREKYEDGLADIDHARTWVQVSAGYANARVGDLSGSADSWNQDIAANGYTGNATMANDAVALGAQWGVLLSPYTGVALGAGYVALTDYKLNVNFQNGPVTDGYSNIYDSDFDQTTLSPTLIPITLDGYLFLPDSSGRFFLSGGVGLYLGNIHVDRNYSDIVQSYDAGDPYYYNQYDTYSGDLRGNALGFQARIGREFQVGNRMGLSFYAAGRYCKMTQFTGTLTDAGGYSANVGLAVEPTYNNRVFVEDTTQIGNNNNGYATVDFSSLEVGFALNWYGF